MSLDTRTPSITIEEIDPKRAAEAEYVALNELANVIRAEAVPDDPPKPLEQTVADLQNVPPVFGVRFWIAWDETGRAVASSDTAILQGESNRHVGQIDIRVTPDHRRAGIGSRLLRPMLAALEAGDRTLVIANTCSTIPAGEHFMEALGASVGLASHLNQLQMNDVDRHLLRLWRERAQERARDFELMLWDEGYPLDQLETAAEMMNAMNTMPRGDLEIEDFKWTPQEVRQLDESSKAAGRIRWTMLVRERASGKLAGFTELILDPAQPDVAEQLGTAVFAPYQNRGVGRWLKAAMLEKLIRERPEVKRVRTGNAQSNAPMLKINTELGFRPIMISRLWQAPLSQVSAYVDRKLGVGGTQ